MKIFKSTLTDEVRSTIFGGFREYAIKKCGTAGVEEPISFYITGADDNIIAAVVVQIFCGALHIKYVWTREDYRNKGYASKLMMEAFDFAKASYCPFAVVETMNFQAPDFYKKFGFKVELERRGYSHGTSFYYMKKEFAQ